MCLVQVLLLLINLVTYSVDNRKFIMEEASAPPDFGNQHDKVSAIQALIDYFYKYEEMAR